MTAAAVLARSAPPAAPAPVPAPASGPRSRAVAYQRVLHQLVRRELRLLADLATWAPADDPARTQDLTRHADLLGRLLLHHHRTERDLLWPALLRSVPADRTETVRARVLDWTASVAGLDHRLRDLSTAARQWAVAGTPPARNAFAMACLDVADAVDAQTAAEERELLPELGAYLPAEAWTAIARAARCPLSGREQLFVLGLALEDACPGDRARLLAALPRSTRLLWRLAGHGRYRATVVRLRGAPPAP
ncbi:hemerythrin domain-containing protein [Geodermatophilus sabuli]|uniref:Hemerythrin domain-containing protein n=1 Tax=Geodermatophilus sabuli TaxID=1564158 RepID=A0A7K3VWQ1_9ACTN|nr:hemerythrin domain-containing protein [Geodermatophilus sabuli]NEK57085.1 hemerythrin domain-containing protein [Geodermatophilus sabuli]